MKVLSGLISVVLAAATWWAYSYPKFCFSHRGSGNKYSMSDVRSRFLFIADPQIEGLERYKREGLYGQAAVWLDDVYLEHVIQRSSSYAQPDFVFVLGDLFSHYGLLVFHLSRH